MAVGRRQSSDRVLWWLSPGGSGGGGEKWLASEGPLKARPMGFADGWMSA